MRKIPLYLIIVFLLAPALVSAQTDEAATLKLLKDRVRTLTEQIQAALKQAGGAAVPAPTPAPTAAPAPAGEEETVVRLRTAVQALRAKIAGLTQAAAEETAAKQAAPAAAVPAAASDPAKLKKSIIVLQAQVDILRPQRVKEESETLEREIAAILSKIAAASEPAELDILENQLVQSETKLGELQAESASIVAQSISDIQSRLKSTQAEVVAVPVVPAPAPVPDVSALRSKIQELTRKVLELQTKAKEETPMAPTAPAPTPAPSGAIDTLKATIESLQARVKALLTATPTPTPVSSDGAAEKAAEIKMKIGDILKRIQNLQNQPTY